MKLNKSLLAVALALGVTGAAQADVYLTGSTAMRNTVYIALTNAGTVFQATPTIWGYGAAGAKDTYMAFKGTLVGGSSPIVIYCTWSGSEDGVAHVVGSVNQSFIDPSFLSANPSGLDQSATGATQTHFCDLAMADNAQSFSRSKTPTLTGAQVGVITFEWLRNKGLWTGSNVTDSMIQQGLGGGAKRAVFTGNPAHTNDYVYVSGRDSGSGTRVNAFGTAGFGILTTPSQIEIDNSGNMLPLSTTTNRFGVVSTNYSGDFGYSSGGNLAKSMQGDTTSKPDYVHTNASAFSVICYAGVSDADSGVAVGATVLTYNGVAFDPTNVIEGTYTYWGNEYIFKGVNVASGSDPDKVYASLSNSTNGIVSFCDGRTAIALTAMHCTRGGPTSAPVHN